MENNTKYNPFDFIRNRLTGIEPTEAETLQFDPFMTQMTLSMKKGTENVLDRINTKQFFNLSKKVQCLAYTSFDGKDLTSFWKKSKSGTKKNNKEIISKIMKVLDCSHNTAVSYMLYDLINLEEIEEIYIAIYEPENVKFRTKKGSK